VATSVTIFATMIATIRSATILVLQEFHPFGGGYSGREMSMEVSYITGRETPCAFSSSALARGFVILSLRPADLPHEQ
jgi:hypothetical protein